MSGISSKDEHVVNKTVYEVDWGTRYRLEPVTGTGGMFRLPPRLDYLTGRESLPKTILVTGERGSGKNNFLNWLIEPSQNTQQQSPRHTPRWQVCHTQPAAAALQTWIQSDHAGPAPWIVLNRPETDTYNEKPDHLAAIAGYLEDNNWLKSDGRLVVITRQASSLSADELFSSILVRGRLFRLPSFTRTELEGWANVLLGKRGGKDFDKRKALLAFEAKKWAGGQPTITNILFSLAKEQQKKLLAAYETALSDAGRKLTSNPPHLVKRWLDDLTGLLQHPLLRRRLEAYVEGEIKDWNGPYFDESDAELYLSGWIGETCAFGQLEDQTPAWGIRSLCHQHWARRALWR